MFEDLSSQGIGEMYIWSWYASLCLVSVFNIVIYLRILNAKTDSKLSSDI